MNPAAPKKMPNISKLRIIIFMFVFLVQIVFIILFNSLCFLFLFSGSTNQVDVFFIHEVFLASSQTQFPVDMFT